MGPVHRENVCQLNAYGAGEFRRIQAVHRDRGVEFVHKLLDVQVVVRVRVIQEDVVAGIKVVNRERSFSFKHRAK